MATPVLLTEGALGVAGKSHMDHLYDNYELTFSDLKKIFVAAADGRLEGTEKTDGQNLLVTYKDGRVKNKSHLNTISDGWKTLKFLLISCPKWLYYIPSIFFLIIAIIMSVDIITDNCTTSNKGIFSNFYISI